MMELLPAIDLIDGRAVRLLRGDFDERSDYGDPLRLAQEFLDGGANWLHVVDLDGAKSGSADNRPIVLAMAALGAAVETGGGYARRPTSRSSSTRGPPGGARTAALEDPAWAGAMGRRFGEQVAIGLDYRRGTDGRPVPATKGWLDASASRSRRGSTRSRRALRAVVVTAIDRDGTLGAPTSRTHRAARPLAVARDCLRRRRLGRGSLRTGADGGLDRAPAGRGHRRQGPRRWPVSMEEAVAACALSA